MTAHLGPTLHVPMAVRCAAPNRGAVPAAGYWPRRERRARRDGLAAPWRALGIVAAAWLLVTLTGALLTPILAIWGRP